MLAKVLLLIQLLRSQPPMFRYQVGQMTQMLAEEELRNFQSTLKG